MVILDKQGIQKSKYQLRIPITVQDIKGIPAYIYHRHKEIGIDAGGKLSFI